MDIKNTIHILSKHLEKYHPDLDGKVLMANVAEDPPNGADESVLITLIKVEEETALKNGPYHRLDHSFKTMYKNRPVYVNLYLLFTCIHSTYSTALTRLSQVIEFFQGQSFFTEKDGEAGTLDAGEKFRLIVEQQNLSFEQLNHLWGFLGGKQKPSVLYKVRLIPLEAKDKLSGTGEPILEVNIDGNTTL
jgi:hypothetical protein